MVFSNYGYSQTIDNQQLDSIIRNRMEDSPPTNLNEVANRLKLEDNSDPVLQYLILAKWIVNHMRYKGSVVNRSLKKSFDTGEGVCWQYSIMMDSLSKYCGFKSNIVRGFIKEKVSSNGKVDLENHSWNVVTLNGTRYYSDITWADNGKTKNEKSSTLNANYLLVPSSKFSLTHLSRKKKYRASCRSKKRFKSSPIIFGGYWMIDGQGINGLHELPLITTNQIVEFIVDTTKLDIIDFELYLCSSQDLHSCDDYVLLEKRISNKGRLTFILDLQKLGNYQGQLTLMALYGNKDEIYGTNVIEFYRTL